VIAKETVGNHVKDSSIPTGFQCCSVSAGAHAVVVSIARNGSEVAPGSGSSPGVVRDSIQAKVLLVTRASMAWGASVFFRMLRRT